MYSLLKNKDSQGKPLAKRCIVVCPCSLVKNWEDEFEKWINSKAHDKNERVECMALSDTSRKTVEGMIDQFERAQLALPREQRAVGLVTSASDRSVASFFRHSAPPYTVLQHPRLG